MPSRIRLILTVFCLSCVASACSQDGAGWAAGDRDKIDPRRVTQAPPPRISPETFFAAGRMLERQHKIPDAIQQYERAIEAAPRMTKAYNRLGMIYQQLLRWQDAEYMFSQGIRADRKSAPAQNNLGFCYLQQEKYGRAEKAFRAALALDPDLGRARMNLGITLARTERFGESIEQFANVVSDEAAFFNLAAIRMDMRDYINAEEALRQALAINPTFEAARTRLTQVATLAAAARREQALSGEKKKDTDMISSPLAGGGEEEPLDIP